MDPPETSVSSSCDSSSATFNGSKTNPISLRCEPNGQTLLHRLRGNDGCAPDISTGLQIFNSRSQRQYGHEVLLANHSDRQWWWNAWPHTRPALTISPSRTAPRQMGQDIGATATLCSAGFEVSWSPPLDVVDFPPSVICCLVVSTGWNLNSDRIVARTFLCACLERLRFVTDMLAPLLTTDGDACPFTILSMSLLSFLFFFFVLWSCEDAFLEACWPSLHCDESVFCVLALYL
mmetsp:Transcript_18283/g.50751  ORF Transcript_18283/g.50751 Transcript_18283/m.50751 type:complete len:234 (-) Transcript_18283:210-911(-)